MRKLPIGKPSLKKITLLAIVLNLVQICAALGLLCYALFSKSFDLPEEAELVLLAAMTGVVVWGAVVDIRDAFITRRVEQQRGMLEEAYRQLEDLNRMLREQRHDFKNHLQVVYSLTEMGAYDDAMDYVRRIYEDVQALGRQIRTASPAVNALLSAKEADCAEKGVALIVDIQSAWNDISLPGWELCRVLGNLIDNAVDAMLEAGTDAPQIRVHIGEDIRSWLLRVENNGPEIPAEQQRDIFLPGFTTKSEGHGNGLSIVRSLLEDYGGQIEVSSDPGSTCFSVCIPKPVLRG